MKTLIKYLDPNQQVCVRAPRMSRMLPVRTLLKFGLGGSTVEDGCVWVSLHLFRSLAAPPGMSESAAAIVSTLLEDGPAIQTLKQHQTPLNADEREQAGSHPINKSVVSGKTYYWSNTHRCYQSATTIAKAVKDYVEIVEPSG